MAPRAACALCRATPSPAPPSPPFSRRERESVRSIVSRTMGVRIGTGLSTVPDARTAGLEAASAASVELGGGPCELAVVFVSGSILSAPDAVLEAIHEVLAPENLIGCGAGGVIGHGREIEGGSAVSVFAAGLGDGS